MGATDPAQTLRKWAKIGGQLSRERSVAPSGDSLGALGLRGRGTEGGSVVERSAA